METTKKTKTMYFAELREIVENAFTDEAMQNELLEFIDKEVAAIARRKDKAKERAEKKKNESDALTERIFAALDEEYMTLDEILPLLDDEEEITKNKVTSRLGKLVKAGRVEKDTVRVEDKKRMAYRKIVEEVAA